MVGEYERHESSRQLFMYWIIVDRLVNCSGSRWVSHWTSHWTSHSVIHSLTSSVSSSFSHGRVIGAVSCGPEALWTKEIKIAAASMKTHSSLTMICPGTGHGACLTAADLLQVFDLIVRWLFHWWGRAVAIFRFGFLFFFFCLFLCGWGFFGF